MTPDYKYNEKVLIDDLMKYVDTTYISSDNSHYAEGKIETTEFIIDAGHGLGFTIGNVIKYAQRYGKKQGYNRKDIMKILHYALMALYIHDQENANGESEKAGTRKPNELQHRESFEFINAYEFDPSD